MLLQIYSILIVVTRGLELHERLFGYPKVFLELLVLKFLRLHQVPFIP